MSNSNDGIHVKAQVGQGWVVESGAGEESTHRDKRTAVKSGRLLAKRHGMQFTVHRKDGTVVDTRSYAKTPI